MGGKNVRYSKIKYNRKIQSIYDLLTQSGTAASNETVLYKALIVLIKYR